MSGQSWDKALVGPLPKSSWTVSPRTQAATTGCVDKSEVFWQDIPCCGVGARDGLAAPCDDLIIETLMSLLFVPDVDASKCIGQAAIGVMYVVAGASLIGAVLEAIFYRCASVAGLQGLPGSVVEVFCRCDREIALARYRQRSEHRHPGHVDLQRVWNDEVTVPVAGGWAVLEINTTRPVNISAVVPDIRLSVSLDLTLPPYSDRVTVTYRGSRVDARRGTRTKDTFTGCSVH